MRKHAKVYILIFLASLAALILLNMHNTAGSYWALVYYEKSDEGYVLKGVEIYAKPIRASGHHNIELVAHSPPLVDFNPSCVKINPIRSKNIVEREIHVYTNKTVLLKPNTEIKTYVGLKNCLTAKEPVKFRVLLSPVKGGWIININNVSVIISSQ